MKRKRGGGGGSGQDAPLSEAALNVLILGDGNLSYSLGLAQRLPNAKVLATSYDDSEEVRAKYADTSAIVARLLALGPRVRVRHGVDALAIRATLASTGASGGAGDAEAEEEVFDHVVFNHPHTGWEDMHRHAALLAHFLESCKGVLAPGGRGQLHVTLAGEQPVRWRLLETARRLGYRLRHVCDFYRQFGPNPLPSEIKRHQSGKSFRLRGLPSFTFTFALGAEAAADADEEKGASPILWRHAYEDHAAVLLPPGALASGGEGAASLKGAVTDVEKTYRCGECERRFRGPKDLRKHVESAHEQRELEAAAPAELVCAPCGGRVFKDRTALEQHTRAKHEGHFQDLKPDWAQQQGQQGQEGQGGEAAADSTTAVATGPAKAAASTGGEGGWREQLKFKGKDAEAYAALLTSDPAAAAAHALCAVCGYHVPTAVDHLGDLRPPERPTFRCLGCERTFHEERALKQHANACAAFLVQLRRRQQQAQQEQAQQEQAPAQEAVEAAAEA